MIQESIERLAEIEIPDNPFPGLRPFELHESLLFFGRESQNERLIEKLSRTRFLAIVGTSGSGKSSLVRAGLLPALLGGMMPSAGSLWRIALLRPGNDPVGNLARALNSHDAFGSEYEDNRNLQIAITEATLRRGNLGLIEAVRQANQPATENLLVIADQFEELFRVEKGTKHEELENDKAAFVKLLLEAARQREVNIYVVLTMRSDYLGECAQFQDLPEAINESQYLIPRLTRDQLRQAITGPVAVGGAEMTPRLINRLLNDIGDKQDQLPILQHALMRTWENWKSEVGTRNSESFALQSQAMGNGLDDPNSALRIPHSAFRLPIDLRHYEAIGGMDEALSKHADEAFLELRDDRQRAIAEKMFKCLTEKGTDNREVRRPVTLREICAVVGAAHDNAQSAPEAEVIAVIEPFRAPGRSFLMPPAGTPLNADSLIDISHESLIRNWQRLSKWVEEEAISARRYLRLAETATLHKEDKAGLWRDPDLQFALAWQEQQQPNEAWAQRYFPDFALAMDFLAASRKAEEERGQQDELEKQRQEAHRKQELRRTRIFAVVLFAAFLFSLATAAYAVSQQLKALRSQEVAEAAQREALRLKDIAEEERQRANQSADEARTHQKEAELKSKEAEASASEAQKQKESAQANAIQANLAQRRAEANAQEAKLNGQIMQEKFGQLLGLQAHRVWEEKQDAQLSTLLAIESLKKAPNEFGDESLRAALKLLPHRVTKKKFDDQPTSAAFSQQGRYLTFVSEEGKVYRWDAERDQLTSRDFEESEKLELSQDGNYLASVSDEQTVQLWRIDTNQPVGKPMTHSNPENTTASPSRIPRPSSLGIAISPDAHYVATTRGDTVQLWAGQTGEQGKSLKHETRVTSVAFSSDSKYLFTTRTISPGATSSTSRSVSIWDVATGQPTEKQIPFTDSASTIEVNKEGSVVALVSGSKIQLWDRKGEKWLTPITPSAAIAKLFFSPDGQSLAGISRDRGRIFVWPVNNSPNPEATHLVPSDFVLALAFSSDGKQLSTFSDDGIVQAWETTAREAVAQLSVQQTGLLQDFTFAGKEHLITAGDRGVQKWETATGRPLEMNLEGLSPESSITSVAVSQDSKYLAVGGDLNAVWDYSTGRLVTLLQPDIPLQLVTMSPDERFVATLRANGDIRVSDFLSRRPLFRGRAMETTLITLSAGGQYLATAQSDHTVRVRKLSRELASPTGPEVILKLQEEASTLGFSRDGRYLVTAAGNIAQIWSAATGRQIGSNLVHGGRINALATGGVNGAFVAIASSDQTVRLWSLLNGRPIGQPLSHEGNVTAVAFSQDGSRLATASDTLVRIWSVGTRQPIGQLINTEGKILSLALRGTTELVTFSEGRTIQVWNLSNGQPRLAQPIKLAAGDKVAFLGEQGRYFLAGNSSYSVWNMSTGKLIEKSRERMTLNSLAFSPDGKRLAGINENNHLQLWDLGTWKLVSTPKAETINTFAFSPDSKTLYWPGRKKIKGGTIDTVISWEIGSDQTQHFDYKDEVTALAPSSDGNSLFVASKQTVWELNPKNGKKLGKFPSHNSSITGLSFNAAGDLLIVGDELVIWQLDPRQKRLRLSGKFAHAHISPDNQYLVTVSPTELVVRWWQPQAMIEDACDRLAQNLKLEEWEEYMGIAEYQKTCSDVPMKPDIIQGFIEEGIQAANEGHFKEAQDIFRFINRLEPARQIDPVTEARWHYDKFREEANYLDLLERLKPEQRVLTRAELEELQRASLRLISLYKRPHKLTSEESSELEGGDLNEICWDGARADYSHQVLPVCELMIHLAPEDTDYRDSRGLARARTGDFKGAIEDFQFYVENAADEERIEQRNRWIEALRAGRNPFTKEELEKLRDQ